MLASVHYMAHLLVDSNNFSISHIMSKWIWFLHVLALVLHAEKLLEWIVGYTNGLMTKSLGKWLPIVSGSCYLYFLLFVPIAETLENLELE